VKLSANEVPFGPLPGVVEAATAALADVHRYPDAAARVLVRALADHLGVPAEDLTTGTGSVGLLGQLVAIAADAGDEIVYPWRSFEAYPIAVALGGARPVPVPLTPDGRHDLPAMAAAVTDATRLVLVCSPNNPTGPTVTAQEFEAFADQVPPDVLIVIDEAYIEFVRDPGALDGITAYRTRPNVVVLRTFSKAYGLAGLRVGFAVGHPRVVGALQAAAVPFGVSSVAQHAAVAALAAQDEMRRRVSAVVAERDRLAQQLRSQGWAVPVTQGNFVWLALGEQSEAFAAACEEAGVVVRAYPPDGVRITAAEPDAGDVVLDVAARWRARLSSG
jgi:histidinol-phosphate aminotransferase